MEFKSEMTIFAIISLLVAIAVLIGLVASLFFTATISIAVGLIAFIALMIYALI